jgi:hypothetical protein
VLSECVQTGSPLDEVEVSTSDDLGDLHQVDLSVLFDTIKANYSTLRFRFLLRGGNRPALAVNNRFDMIARLNRAGRSYLETDSGDKRKGLAVI